MTPERDTKEAPSDKLENKLLKIPQKYTAASPVVVIKKKYKNQKISY